jgi:hypothetical protein
MSGEDLKNLNEFFKIFCYSNRHVFNISSGDELIKILIKLWDCEDEKLLNIIEKIKGKKDQSVEQNSQQNTS